MIIHVKPGGVKGRTKAEQKRERMMRVPAEGIRDDQLPIISCSTLVGRFWISTIAAVCASVTISSP